MSEGCWPTVRGWCFPSKSTNCLPNSHVSGTSISKLAGSRTSKGWRNYRCDTVEWNACSNWNCRIRSASLWWYHLGYADKRHLASNLSAGLETCSSSALLGSTPIHSNLRGARGFGDSSCARVSPPLLVSRAPNSVSPRCCIVSRGWTARPAPGSSGSWTIVGVAYPCRPARSR